MHGFCFDRKLLKYEGEVNVGMTYQKMNPPHPRPLPCLRRSGFAQAGARGEEIHVQGQGIWRKKELTM